MQIRPARPGDEVAVARVHVRSWQVAYHALLPAEYLAALRPEDRAKTYDFATLDPAKPQTIVAEDDGLIHGFATTMRSRDPDLPHHAELCALYVNPDQWNRRIGAALIEAARAHLVTLGFQNAFLWVLLGNTRAERFYQLDGWTSDGNRRAGTVWDITVDEIRYVRSL